MGKKLNKILKGQITTSIFYIAFGLCLVLMPVKTVNILCKVVFGLVMIGAGLYHIYVFVREKENTTILDLFSGVIVLVIGGFLFTNPQVVIKLLPVMLGAFILVDSIWTFRGGMKLRKKKLDSWKMFLLVSLIFIALGIFLISYPFQTVNVMLMFAGWIFLCNGVLDVIMYIVLNKGMKKEITEEAPMPFEEKKAQKQTDAGGTSEDKRAVMEYMEYTEAVKEPVSKAPVKDPASAAPVEEPVSEAFVEEPAPEASAEAEEEPLEEWKD